MSERSLDDLLDDLDEGEAREAVSLYLVGLVLAMFWGAIVGALIVGLIWWLT